MEPAVAVSALLPTPAVGRAAVPTPRPWVVRPGDVGGRAPWQVLHREGALRAVTDDVAVGAGTPVTAEVRATGLTGRVPPRAVVVGRTAFWVWCGGPLDDALDLAYRSSGFRLGAESRDIGGVRVTTPERTAVDLSSRWPRAEALAAAVALGRSGADLGAALLLLDSRTRAAGRSSAREVLRTAREMLPRSGSG